MAEHAPQSMGAPTASEIHQPPALPSGDVQPAISLFVKTFRNSPNRQNVRMVAPQAIKLILQDALILSLSNTRKAKCPQICPYRKATEARHFLSTGMPAPFGHWSKTRGYTCKPHWNGQPEGTAPQFLRSSVRKA